METKAVERSPGLIWPALFFGAAVLSLVVGFAVATPMPDLWTVLAFGVLFAFAENIDFEIPSGAGQSAGFMIVVASMVVFAIEGTPLGAVLVGLIGSLFIPHVLDRDWRKLLCNAGANALAIAVGTAVLLAFPESWLEGVPLLLVSATLAAVVAFMVNATCIGLSIAIAQHRPPRDVLLTLLPGQWLIYPFAVLGAGLGWLELHAGPIPLVLTITPILVGRQAFVSYMRAHEADEAALTTLVQALEAKDSYTAGHAERVAAYARFMGEHLGLRGRALEQLRRAALMHDIGKLIVPNQLLNKPGRLTAEEYERVRLHEDVTVELLGRITFLAPVAPIAIGVYAGPDEDERTHGMIERHIVAVADAYDAMTSTRAYRRALPQDVAFMELRANAGTQFHPACVEALIAALERRDLHHGAGYEAPERAAEWAVPPPDTGPGSAGLGDFAADTHPR